ncbi:MAG TPA: heterodisulfide reductase-related iron-sulfur binding cluster [Methylomirabilota bacterium]|nr:heterodisulfide reductase-related iron-sulfur binding cluster [Methylomirabilota bacterium]
MLETAATDTAFRGLTLNGLSVEGVNQCVHCGLCLSYCPTYSELGTEMDSPRGRIFLIKSLAEQRIALTDSVVNHLGLCLDCRACETACPSGVPYGRLIEVARAEIERQRPGSRLRQAFRRVNLELLLANPAALSLLTNLLRFYQRSGLQSLVRGSGMLGLFPQMLGEWERLLPKLPDTHEGPLPELTPAQGEKRARVGLLAGCVQQAVFGSHNHATARLLARNGAEVVTPGAQRCCGALHAHAGARARAVALARQTIDCFEGARVDAVIANTSGCGAHMKGYAHLLQDDPDYAERAERFSKRVQDIAEFLGREPLRGVLGRVEMRVTYHDPCHVVHGQKIRTEPRRLLRAIPGITVTELHEADWCCGSAGIYNLTQPEMAERLLRRKVANLEATGAEAVVTANPGCIIQILHGLEMRGGKMRVYHLVEILDLAYRQGERA